MVTERTFWEADSLAAFLRKAKFDVVVQARSDRPSLLRSLVGSNSTIHDCHLSPPLSTVGAIVHEMVEISVPLDVTNTGRVDGRVFGQGIFIATPQREHFMATPCDIHFMTLQINQGDLLAHWHLLIGAPWNPAGGLVGLSLGESRRVRALAEAMVRYMARGGNAATGDAGGDSRFPAVWQSVFLDAIILAVAGALPGRPRLSVSGRRRIMSDAMESMRRYPAAALSVLELCRVCATTERSLRNAFLSTLGVGPRAYIRLRRLHLARRELKRVAPHGASVARIATDHGFFDLGRFAGDYRKLFGELPSETLRRG